MKNLLKEILDSDWFPFIALLVSAITGMICTTIYGIFELIYASPK